MRKNKFGEDLRKEFIIEVINKGTDKDKPTKEPEPKKYGSTGYGQSGYGDKK